MDDNSIGWIASVVIGGVAGWLAEMVTRSNMGVLTTIILGIIDAALATWLFGSLNIRLEGGWLSYVISGFVGACVLLLATRRLSPNRWRA